MAQSRITKYSRSKNRIVTIYADLNVMISFTNDKVYHLKGFEALCIWTFIQAYLFSLYLSQPSYNYNIVICIPPQPIRVFHPVSHMFCIYIQNPNSWFRNCRPLSFHFIFFHRVRRNMMKSTGCDDYTLRELEYGHHLISYRTSAFVHYIIWTLYQVHL